MLISFSKDFEALKQWLENIQSTVLENFKIASNFDIDVGIKLTRLGNLPSIEGHMKELLQRFGRAELFLAS